MGAEDERKLILSNKDDDELAKLLEEVDLACEKFENAKEEDSLKESHKNFIEKYDNLIRNEKYVKALTLIEVKIDLKNQRNIKAEYVKAEDERKSILSNKNVDELAKLLEEVDLACEKFENAKEED